MELLYFLIAGVLLYFVSDRIVRSIEKSWTVRKEHREILFFLILMTLALASFALIRRLVV